jgi:hypothetical protein
MPLSAQAHKAHKGYKVLENRTVFYIYRVLCGLCADAGLASRVALPVRRQPGGRVGMHPPFTASG